MKFVISPQLGKNMIPPMRDDKPGHIDSSCQWLGLAYTVLESPLVLTKVVNRHRAPCLTWQHWVTPSPLPVPQWSVQLPYSSALKFSDLPVASFLASQIDMATKKGWWVVALRAAGWVTDMSSVPEGHDWVGHGTASIPKGIPCNAVWSCLGHKLQLVPSLGHP